MTPLQLDPQGLPNGWADVKPGDAVVAFSRKNIYKARKVCKPTGAVSGIDDKWGFSTYLVYSLIALLTWDSSCSSCCSLQAVSQPGSDCRVDVRAAALAQLSSAA